jgi:hypothetical protein
MNGHRTCIICLPRTGSQLCVTLSEEIKESMRLGEYFENWNRHEYFLDNDTLRLKNTHKIISTLMICKNFEERLDLLKKVNKNQSFTLRLFLMDNYDKEVLSKIIVELKNIGFEFLTLTRNISDQLLSFMIARETSRGKSDITTVFRINNEINEPVYINLNALNYTLNQIYSSHLKWEKNLSTILHNIEYQKVKYESIYEDMENIYNRKFNYVGKKTINGDPFDLIINKEEVMSFLSNKISGLGVIPALQTLPPML